MIAPVVYNENDPFAAEWLRKLIKAGLIAAGEVDTRSIVDVGDDDYRGYVQVHLFAGIGGWPYALRLAGWDDDRPVWTGSCPCQPFSAAGKRKGTSDARHLWPDMRRLITKCNPPVVFGEQVASKDGRLWLTGVRAELEALDYAVGAADLCSAGTGAPHIRQRIWWLADADGGIARHGELQSGRQHGQQQEDDGVDGMADPDSWQCNGLADGQGCLADRPTTGWLESDGITECRGAIGRLVDADQPGSQGRLDRFGEGGRSDQRLAWPTGEPGFWSTYDIVHCTDGKARRTGSGIFPLAHGVPNRVGLLRGAGNAINPWLAAEFIRASVDAMRATG